MPLIDELEHSRERRPSRGQSRVRAGLRPRLLLPDIEGVIRMQG